GIRGWPAYRVPEPSRHLCTPHRALGSPVLIGHRDLRTHRLRWGNTDTPGYPLLTGGSTASSRFRSPHRRNRSHARLAVSAARAPGGLDCTQHRLRRSLGLSRTVTPRTSCRTRRHYRTERLSCPALAPIHFGPS